MHRSKQSETDLRHRQKEKQANNCHKSICRHGLTETRHIRDSTLLLAAQLSHDPTIQSEILRLIISLHTKCKLNILPHTYTVCFLQMGCHKNNLREELLVLHIWHNQCFDWHFKLQTVWIFVVTQTLLR
jgi:hypothetical protein